MGNDCYKLGISTALSRRSCIFFSIASGYRSGKCETSLSFGVHCLQVATQLHRDYPVDAPYALHRQSPKSLLAVPIPTAAQLVPDSVRVHQKHQTPFATSHRRYPQNSVLDMPIPLRIACHLVCVHPVCIYQREIHPANGLHTTTT